MDEKELSAERFEGYRPHLRAVAYRMLGSLSEADDAVQEAWLRLSRIDENTIENLGGWLTTVVARVCLDLLRARQARREDAFDDHPPLPARNGNDADYEAELADSVGLALLVVLDRLTPAERLAFVLHDMFDFPFEDIAPIVGRSGEATRQLASRARRRVRGGNTVPDADLASRRKVVEAYIAAAQSGDFDALLEVLDPDVVLRVDASGPGRPIIEVRGASRVAKRALAAPRRGRVPLLVLVNGSLGIMVAPYGRVQVVLVPTIAHGKVVEVEVITNRERLRELDFAVFEAESLTRPAV